MKIKNLLIWGTALILIITAVYITGNYNKNSANQKNTTDNITDNTEQQTDIGNTGEKALNFTLKDLDGNTVSLMDYQGQNVYVNFFATWCPPCREEMPEIEKISQKYKDNLVVLAVDIGEDNDTVKKFIQENNYSFKVLVDSEEAAAYMYQINSIPVSIFIDKEGNIVAKRVGALTMDEMESYVKMLLDKK